MHLSSNPELAVTFTGESKNKNKTKGCHPIVEATVRMQKERKRRGLKVGEPMQRQSVM